MLQQNRSTAGTCNQFRLSINFKLSFMKNLKIVLSCLLLAAGLIGFSAFSLKGTNHAYNAKAFSRVCFDYIGTFNGPNGTPDQIQTASAWEDIGNTVTDCPATNTTLCGICFDNSQLTGDPEEPNSNVLSAVAAHYSDNTGSTTGVAISGTSTTVDIYLKP